jgi:hypothetical protein
LWTTAGDLARLTRALQASYDGRGDFLPREVTRETLRRQTPLHEIGLGVYLLGDGPGRRFGHRGNYLGYGGEFLGWLEGGRGVAVLINNGYTAPAFKEELIETVIRCYGWPS